MIRPAAVSGMFYPSHPAQLEQFVDTLLGEFNARKQAGLLGLVAPHAGYEFSGRTAAAAYAQIPADTFKTVVILSPSHREIFSNVSIYQGDAYATPLGRLNVDADLRTKLVAQSEIIVTSIQGHRDEHAIEVHLPFIQRILPEAMIVPIVIGDQQRDCVKALGEALAETVNFDDTLIVASSDLSHFHSLAEAEKLDSVARDAIERLDPDTLLQGLDEGTTEACGGGPLAAMLYAALANGASSCRILDQTTSAEVTRDTTRVVGYLSAAVFRN